MCQRIHFGPILAADPVCCNCGKTLTDIERAAYWRVHVEVSRIMLTAQSIKWTSYEDQRCSATLMRNKEEQMLIVTEKIPPPRRPEIFDDGIKVDAASQKQEDQWVKDFIANLAGVFSKTGK